MDNIGLNNMEWKLHNTIKSKDFFISFLPDGYTMLSVIGGIDAK